jgi:hypothetical protein
VKEKASENCGKEKSVFLELGKYLSFPQSQQNPGHKESDLPQLPKKDVADVARTSRRRLQVLDGILRLGFRAKPRAVKSEDATDLST